MRKFLSLLSLMYVIISCGDDNPADSGQPVANQTFNLPGGSFVEFRFTIDSDAQQNIFLQGKFTVEGGSVQMAVMSGAEFITWQDGGTPGVIYSPGNTSSDTFRLPFDESDVYYVVFSNAGQTDVTVKSEIFLLGTQKQGENT